MAGDSAVSGLEFHGAVRSHQHGGHHGETPESGGDHVTHDVAVIVLAGPDVAALAADDPGHGVVDEGVEVGQTQLFKLRLVPGLVLLFKDLLEVPVVDLSDGVLGGEPQVLLGVDGVLETGPGEGTDGGILVVGALPHGGTVHLLDYHGLLFTRDTPEGHGALTRLVSVEIHALVHVAVGVTGDSDGLFPVLHHGLDGVDQDGGAEHSTVQNGADGAVGALPHLRQLGILLHALLVGGDGGALNRHSVFPGGVGGIHRHLVLGLIAVQ